MFAARCLGVSLAVFLLLYVPLSLAVVAMAKSLLSIFPSQRFSTSFLFGLRMFPLAFSLAVTVLFSLPSFLLLEPRSTEEAVGVAPAILGMLAFTVLIVGCLRAALAQRRSAQALAKWLDGSTACESISSVPVFRTGNFTPTLAVAGVLDPKVVLSECAAAALTPAELRAALRHEVAHARTYDNLRKLLFRFVAFPGMKVLEDAWREAAELQADDAAVSRAGDAIDLASALLKISRLLPPQPVVPELATPHSATAFQVRLQRLVAWDENLAPTGRAPKSTWVYAGTSVFALLSLACTYNSALSAMHTFTEWLVR
jgi:Zn-dependent protease with chaperone function